MGEEKTVSGVYVCEFAGIGWANDIGYYREWRGYVKDGKTTETIVLGVAEDGGIVELDLGLIPDYLMGEQCAEGAHFAPYISVKLSDDEGMWFENDEGVIEATYGAKILSYECDEPIENNIGPSR